MSNLSPGILIKARREAVKKRIWLNALDDLERGIMNLTIRFVETPRNNSLKRILVSILAKLEHAAESAFKKHIENYGFNKLFELVQFSKACGNTAARGWIEHGFAEWLALNNYNDSGWCKPV